MTYRIYMITGPNGKRYIGKTRHRNVESRWREHIAHAERGAQQVLHKAIRKYGAEAFTLVVLCECVDAREASVVERGLIAQYGTYWSAAAGYNMTCGGEGTTGRKHSEAHKEAMRLLYTGRPLPEWQRKQLQERWAAYWTSDTPERKADRVAKQQVAMRRYWASIPKGDPRRCRNMDALRAMRTPESLVRAANAMSKTKRENFANSEYKERVAAKFRATLEKKKAVKLSREIMDCIIRSIEIAKAKSVGISNG